ncbi:hypothetical protein DRO64_04935 [Candidatus Bathyarchaeota archaeon]|nr:MAG: hypothetical protein DRO64_04935 [Candidatus Bathyarchaeota archaeon]
MAAGECGVEDEVASLIDLAIQLRKHNLSPAEAKAGGRLLGRLWSLGVDEKDLEAYTNRLYIESRKTDLRPRELIQAAQRLLTLKKKTGKTYQAIQSEYENLSKEEERLKERVQNLRKELNQMLREKNTTTQLLEEYTKTRDQLKSHGLDISDLNKAVTLLKNLKESNYNPTTIIQTLTRIESLEREENQLNLHINKLKKDLRGSKERNIRNKFRTQQKQVTTRRSQQAKITRIQPTETRKPREHCQRHSSLKRNKTRKRNREVLHGHREDI